MKKKYYLIIFLILGILKGFSQQGNTEKKHRVQKLASKLDSLQNNSIIGLKQTVDFNVSSIELPAFIRAIGKARKVNISVARELDNIMLTHNFSNATIKDVLLYLCKEYELTIGITGNIISLKKYIPKPQKTKPYISKKIPVTYDSKKDLLSFELKNDTLSIAFKKITDITGINLVFSPGLGNKKISGYIQNKSFESAMDKLAFSNNLILTKTNDNYYLFENGIYSQSSSLNKKLSQNKSKRPSHYRKSNFFFKVKNLDRKLLDVDFENIEVVSIIKEIANELNVNTFTNIPLNQIGKASIKASNISYDKLLRKILEDTSFTYKKKNGIYYFGKEEQASLRSAVVIPLMHRSIEIMNQSMQSRKNYHSGNVYNPNASYNSGDNNSFSNNQRSRISSQQNINTRNSQSFKNYDSKSEALVNILPQEVIKDLEIKTDIEQNTFIVSGDAQKIEKFKRFISKIDKPVPVILIEVMILEVSKSATVSTGVEFGLGASPLKDSGSLFPSTEINIGASTINKIIGGFNGFGSLNIGKVVPNFFAKIQLLETNGNVKIRSTPKLSTLNGHQATLSNGERSYYKVKRTDVIGSQNPQTIQTNNYIPIDADLSINIRPIVSGDEQITLSINVNQSSFNGKRIEPEAPPGMNSREFTSTIRVRDQDVVILGGLEENIKNNSGSGIPFLARIPIIKWLFSKKTRTNSKTRLSVLIKPTIIR
ncbi:type II secretion system protein GspD [Tenacibaculum maritimum]|uniref:type II secretion system protein GspD n=1 Tax=Tenacibaculum maritimum TaxID=107401 RepID=UPI003876FC0F